jgi:ABC-type sugar transport system permease subunit
MPNERLFPKNRVATAILLLSALFFLSVLWVPIIQTFVWSFTKKFMFDITWVGLDNYRKLFADDPLFWQSIKNTFLYALMVVPPVVILGLFLAVLVNAIENLVLRGALTGSYFMAYVVPLVAVAIVWRYMFEPSRIGLFNAILGALGLSPLRWLASPRTSLLSLAIVSIWKNIGYVLVIYLAGLQTIPDVFHEAAMIDGANRWQRFRHVTLPLLVPTILFALVLSTISAMMMFTEAFVLTIQSGQMPGGPLGSTTTMVLYIYQSAFSFQKEGYASAIAVILFVIILMITFVQFRVVRSRFEY